jgi:general stress protein YciG
MTMSDQQGEPAKRGFAAMDAALQRDIARRGGRSVPSDKRSFSISRDLAVEAGRKGGKSVPGGKRSFAMDPTLAAEAGRRGRERIGGGPARDDGTDNS